MKHQSSNSQSDIDVKSIISNASKSATSISYPSQTIVKAKLEMTAPADHDEIEADNAANEIINGGKISRKISEGNSSSGVRVSTAMENQLSHMQGGGQTMPHGLLSMMESGFGRDFSQVRLHTDSQAAEMSSSINAKAFTLGNDIYFNKGQFSPNTSEGQRLVAHELTHVAQNSNNRIKRNYDGPTIGPAPTQSQQTDENTEDDITGMDVVNCLIQLKNLIVTIKTYKETQEILGKLLDGTITVVKSNYSNTLISSWKNYGIVKNSRDAKTARMLSQAGNGAHLAVNVLGKGIDMGIWAFCLICDVKTAVDNYSKTNVEFIYYLIRALATAADCPIAPWPPQVKAILLTFNTASGIGDLYVNLTNPYERAENVGNFWGGADTVGGKLGFLAGSIPILSDIGVYAGEKAAQAYLGIFGD